MNKKLKAIIAIGGTGGHVFPGYNLAKHLKEKNFDVKLITDKRGNKFLKKNENFDISILPSSPIISKNIIYIFLSLILISYSILRSLIFLILNRPSIIFGMGGYASFPICIAASILKIDFMIYENNLIIGKANKFLMPFTNKILVAYEELKGIPKRFKNKVLKIGNIIDKEIIALSRINIENINYKKINLLVLGGSQAAKVFAEILPDIFIKCSNNGIKLKIYQHCLNNQNEKLKLIYQKNNIEFEIFNFSNKLANYLLKANLAITRSGSSILAELTNAKIPFISVPLPSAAENHQFENATYYKEKNLSFLVEEKNLNAELFYLIKDIYENNIKLAEIIKNQSQFSDKNVYNNVDQLIKEIINEKN